MSYEFECLFATANSSKNWPSISPRLVFISPAPERSTGMGGSQHPKNCQPTQTKAHPHPSHPKPAHRCATLPPGDVMKPRTKKQIEAARRNGAKSRGPVTADGKARSSQNALKHGLHSRVLVLTSESEETYAGVRDEYFQHYDPQTRPEIDAVNDIIAARWRLNRILALETAAIDIQMDRMEARVSQEFARIDEGVRTVLAVSESDRTLTLLSRQERSLRRTIERATREIERLKAERAEAENCENEPTVEQPEQIQLPAKLITMERRDDEPTKHPVPSPSTPPECP